MHGKAVVAPVLVSSSLISISYKVLVGNIYPGEGDRPNVNIIRFGQSSLLLDVDVDISSHDATTGDLTSLLSLLCAWHLFVYMTPLLPISPNHGGKHHGNVQGIVGDRFYHMNRYNERHRSINKSFF